MRLLGADRRVRELRAAARGLRMELEHPSVAGHPAVLDGTTGLGGVAFGELVETLATLRVCLDRIDKAHPLTEEQRTQLGEHMKSTW